MQIEQIDLLVHPDYQFRIPGCRQPDLRSQWVNRAFRLHPDPKAILLYVPAVPRGLEEDIKTAVLPVDRETAEHEHFRRKIFSFLLRERLIIFNPGTGNAPTKEEILYEFGKHSFVFNPIATQLYAYGEYLEACVSIWQSKISTGLGIPPQNCHILPDLSLEYPLLLTPGVC